MVELTDIPMYNEDLWGDFPASITRMKQQIEQADGILFVSPEYNRSFTAILKNAIDWGTRLTARTPSPESRAPSLGRLPVGTAVGQSQLKSVLNSVHVIVMGQPEIHLTWNAAGGRRGAMIAHRAALAVIPLTD